MSFLAPLYLWLGAAAAAGVVALHFIVTHQPRSEPFPTARFVPQSPVQAVSNTTRPTDLLLMLLRVFAILCIAGALARPILTPGRVPVARIVIADISTASRLDDVRDSAKRYFRTGDVLIALGSRPQIVAEPDSIPRYAGSLQSSTISTAVISAIRSASTLRDRADSIALVLVSALPSNSWDAATDTIRSLWPGAIKVIRVNPGTTAATSGASVRANWTGDDPLRYSVELAAKRGQFPPAQIVRSGHVSESVAGTTIHWPAAERPRFSQSAPEKSRTAVVVDGVVIVAPFKTVWEFPADSLNDAQVIARWSDGAPAAIQRDTRAGCIRSVSIPVPNRGDLVIRPEFVNVVGRLLIGCRGTPAGELLSDSLITRLQGGTAAAPRNAFAAQRSERSPFTLWLLVAAAILLGAELFLRRSTSRGAV